MVQLGTMERTVGGACRKLGLEVQHPLPNYVELVCRDEQQRLNLGPRAVFWETGLPAVGILQLCLLLRCFSQGLWCSWQAGGMEASVTKDRLFLSNSDLTQDDTPPQLSSGVCREGSMVPAASEGSALPPGGSTREESPAQPADASPEHYLPAGAGAQSPAQRKGCLNSAPLQRNASCP